MIRVSQTVVKLIPQVSRNTPIHTYPAVGQKIMQAGPVTPERMVGAQMGTQNKGLLSETAACQLSNPWSSKVQLVTTKSLGTLWWVID